jgi:metal-responsive CopG/Arc/MetJ family transcriptional regulator
MTMKMTISVTDGLFAEVDARARKVQTTRSGVVADALREYLDRCEAEELRGLVDAYYADSSPEEEAAERETRRAAVRRQMDQLNRDGFVWKVEEDGAGAGPG